MEPKNKKTKKQKPLQITYDTKSKEGENKSYLKKNQPQKEEM